jgi:hypothetical protein
MSKEMFNNFKESVKDFFLNPERNPDGSRMAGYNMQNVYAVLIGGFVGWLVITVTFGTRLKRLLKKVPVLNMVFPKAKATYRRAKTRVAQYRKRK